MSGVAENNMSCPLWQPQPAAADTTAMGRFVQDSAARFGFAADYTSLYRWSLQSPEEFWPAVATFTGLEFSTPPAETYRPGKHWYSGDWFPGARLNYAEQLLRGDAEQVVLIARDERGRRSQLTRGDLRRQVNQVASALRAAGVCPGDGVAAVLPNCPEAVVAMLACAAVGGVFSSCSPDFGTAAITERFAQTEPRVMFVCDGYSYGGKRIECSDKFARVSASLPTVERTVLVAFLDDEPLLQPDQVAFAEWAMSPLDEDADIEYEQFDFAHPLFVMFSSGTTGTPKCIVHSAGGTLLQHLKEHVLHTDLSPGERIFYFTTCGWMMWNWLVSALASGAAIVLYDGSPLHPDPSVLWKLAAQEQLTVFGTSPRFLDASEQAGVPETHDDLQSLRAVLSTGAPLAPAAFDFVAEQLPGVQLCSISGGTDLISCFVLGNPLLPVWRGEIQGPGLGMAVDVVDDDGRSLPAGQGELVCTQPFPSMPLGFRNDTDGSRYRAAYFERYPGLWRQGDLAEWTEHNGMRIHGRADATLNPGGVRIGTAEVCAPALTVPEVIDAVAVGQRQTGDERIVLCVVLSEGTVLDESLTQRIRNVIREASSPRHVPAVIFAVPELPRTISGKTVELTVRAAIHGEPVGNLAALANPEALEHFRNRPELA